VKLGGLNAQSIRNRDEAQQLAERLRPVLAELAGMPARAIARELTRVLGPVDNLPNRIFAVGGFPW
jgi:hypothetical protein